MGETLDEGGHMAIIEKHDKISFSKLKTELIHTSQSETSCIHTRPCMHKKKSEQTHTTNNPAHAQTAGKK